MNVCVFAVARPDPGGAGQVLRVGQEGETTSHAALPHLVRQRQLRKNIFFFSSSIFLFLCELEVGLKTPTNTPPVNQNQNIKLGAERRSELVNSRSHRIRKKRVKVLLKCGAIKNNVVCQMRPFYFKALFLC